MPFIDPRDARSAADAAAVRSWAVKVIISMAVLSAVAVLIRLLSRRIRHQKLWWDDWLCIISMFWGFVIASLVLAEISINGMGIHQSDLDAGRITRLIQIFTVGEIAYGWNIALTKISVLLLYYRLLQVAFQTSSVLRAVGYGITALVIISALVFLFTSVFECIPVQKRWRPELPGHCMEYVIPWTLNAVLTILTDVAILVLPVPQIWKMRLGVMEKMGVTSIFALGWCVTCLSGYRLHLLLIFPDSDFTYSILPAVVWSYIEIVGGIVSACLPVSKPAMLWTTHKLRLTGQDGFFSKLGSLNSSRGSTSNPAGTTDARKQSKSASITIGGPQAEIGGGSEGFPGCLESGNMSLYHITSAGQSSRVDSNKGKWAERETP